MLGDNFCAFSISKSSPVSLITFVRLGNDIIIYRNSAPSSFQFLFLYFDTICHWKIYLHCFLAWDQDHWYWNYHTNKQIWLCTSHLKSFSTKLISYFAKFCNCGGWQVKALPCEPMSWRSMRADGTDEVWRQSTGEFPLAQGGQSFCYIRAFNWLDEAHSHYGEQSDLLKIHWFKYNLIQNILQFDT